MVFDDGSGLKGKLGVALKKRQTVAMLLHKCATMSQFFRHGGAFYNLTRDLATCRPCARLFLRLYSEGRAAMASTEKREAEILAL